MAKIGDLVVYDGWFGIVTTLESVFLGDGLDLCLSVEEIQALQPIGANNFGELVRYFNLQYDATVKITRIL